MWSLLTVVNSGSSDVPSTSKTNKFTCLILAVFSRVCKGMQGTTCTNEAIRGSVQFTNEILPRGGRGGTGGGIGFDWSFR